MSMLHPIEAATAHDLGALVDEKLKALVALAKARSPFHQARLALDRPRTVDMAAEHLVSRGRRRIASASHSPRRGPQ